MKKYLPLIIIILLLPFKAGGQVADSLKYISLKPREFREKLQSSENSLLIDVRETFEFKKSRIEKAGNIPSSGNLDQAADTLKNASSLFLYCTSGFRSKRVAKRLYDLGLRNLYSLDGGIKEWQKEKMPVSRKKIKKMK